MAVVSLGHMRKLTSWKFGTKNNSIDHNKIYYGGAKLEDSVRCILCSKTFREHAFWGESPTKKAQQQVQLWCWGFLKNFPLCQEKKDSDTIKNINPKGLKFQSHAVVPDLNLYFNVFPSVDEVLISYVNSLCKIISVKQWTKPNTTQSL